MDFIAANKDQPFFAYLAYNTPHSPMQVPDSYWDRFATKQLEKRHRDPARENVPHTRAALAMCENIDWNVGRLLKQLKTLELDSETIVVFFCDNGPNGSRWNGDMKGRKGSTDEGGVRSPLFIRWPGSIPAGRKINEIGAAIDLLPTLTDLAGFPAPRPKALDGISLKPLLVSERESWPDRLIFSHWRNRTSVRSRTFRLGHEGGLFDLSKDPGQRNDIRNDRPQVHQRLSTAAAIWKQDALPAEAPEFRPFPIGHADATHTQIPARDGKVHGNLERSNRFPNCSFFSNWQSTDDYISWDVEVLESGTYAVELHYACSKSDIGATMELEWKNQKLQGKITEAHNPPLRGAENDRVKRIESYVKSFRATAMGNIWLEKGRGELRLKASEIPGKKAIDFRLLVFKRTS